MGLKRPGQIAILRFPHTDLEIKKYRPCLLLNRLPGPYDDWLIAMISTKIHQYIEGMDEIIKSNSPDFGKSGLKTESVIRVTRLAVIEGDILIGAIGEISRERLSRIRNNLANWLTSADQNIDAR